MLSYYDDSGELISRYLGFPSIETKWLLFEKPQVELMANYIKVNMNNQYIILNHKSFSVMNPRLMDYQGAFGLCKMPITNKNKELSLKFNDTHKVYTDVSNIDNVSEKELIIYLHRVFYNDYGFIINKFNRNIDFKKILSQVIDKNILNISSFNLDSISLFVDYDDLFRGIVTLYISGQINNRFEKSGNNISLEKIEEINNVYGCRLAGNTKINLNY